MPLAYDATNDALLRPELRATLFAPGGKPSPVQLGIEGARLAYLRFEESAHERERLAQALACAGFDRVRHFHSDPFVGSEAFGALRSADGTALVAFRGTQPDKITDLATDGDFRLAAWGEGAGEVHAGFRRAYLALASAVDSWLRGEALGARLIVSGHSLGGAMAALCASIHRPSLLVTLGAPRTGDQTFAASLAGIDEQRLVGCCDIVARLPPQPLGYRHTEKFTYITYDGLTLASPTQEVVDADREKGRWVYLNQFAWKRGTAPVRELADHAPVNYARAFF